MVKDDLKLRVGMRIKDLRISRGFSQEQFALEIHMDRSYFASIEVGKRNVTLLNLAKIANGLSISLSELFDGIEINESDLEIPCKSRTDYAVITTSRGKTSRRDEMLTR